MAHRPPTSSHDLVNEAATCSYESISGENRPAQDHDWKRDIAAAQHERRFMQKRLIQRVLLVLVSVTLLGLVTFFGWHYYHPRIPNTPHHRPTRPPPRHLPSLPPPHCPAKIPFKDSGTFLVDPDKIKNMFLFVKAGGSLADVIIERDQGGGGHREFDDKHRDMIRIRAKIFVDNPAYQERIRIAEGREKENYVWKLEDTSESPRESHHRYRCVRALVHVRLPRRLEHMDMFNVGILAGSIESKNLKEVQFDRFFAAATCGALRLDELNTKSEAMMETVTGQIMLNHARGNVITLLSMSGSIHMTNTEANELMQMYTVGGSQYIDRVKTSELRAQSLDNRIHLHGVMADMVNVTTVRNDILADVDVARQFHAHSMSGMVRAHVRCACKRGEKERRIMDDPLSNTVRTWNQEVEHHGKWMADVSVVTVSGQAHLTMAEGYKGRFVTSSMTGWVEVHGKEAEVRKGLHDPHFKYGWVRGGSGENAPMVLAKSLTGSVAMNFE